MKRHLRAVHGGDGAAASAGRRRRGCGRYATRAAPSQRRGDLGGFGVCVWRRSSVLMVAVSEQQLETELAAGALSCPGCSGRLARWGFARPREVRMLAGVRSVQPRRACCGGCGATHVLVPAWSVPRRRDGSEVIGEALRHAAGGAGHRVIARRLGRPQGTVRGWLRAARARAEPAGCARRDPPIALDPEPRRVTPAGSILADAVEALAIAVRAWALRFGSQHRRVGARGVADRRAADRNAAAAAVAGRCSRAPARPRCHPAARGGCGSSAATTVDVSPACSRRFDRSRRSSPRRPAG